MLRVRHPGDGQAQRRGHGSGRGAGLPVLRRAGPDRVRRRHRVPWRYRGEQGRVRRRRGRPGLRRGQLRDRPEVRARPAGVERDLHRGTGARDRPVEAGRHRDARRREAGQLARGTEHGDRPGRRGAEDHPGEHAVRQPGRRRVRHLLHRLRGHPVDHRAHAHQHVHRQPARQHRPDPRLLHSAHRLPVLRSVRGLPRRPARCAGASGESATVQAAPQAAGGDGSLGIGSLKGSLKGKEG